MLFSDRGFFMAKKPAKTGCSWSYRHLCTSPDTARHARRTNKKAEPGSGFGSGTGFFSYFRLTI